MHHSACHCYHSTETTLARAQSDMLKAVDNGCESVPHTAGPLGSIQYLTMQDHPRLSWKIFCILGDGLQWMASHLHGRSQSIIIDVIMSDTATLLHGSTPGFGARADFVHHLHISGLLDKRLPQPRNPCVYAGWSWTVHLFFFRGQEFHIPAADPSSCHCLCCRCNVLGWLSANYN